MSGQSCGQLYINFNEYAPKISTITARNPDQASWSVIEWNEIDPEIELMRYQHIQLGAESHPQIMKNGHHFS